jgi:hypothetical protein
MSAAVERDLWQQISHRAWPLPWRVGRRDVERCYLKLVTEGEADFAGSTYRLSDGEVSEVHYDFNAWRRWQEEEAAAIDWTNELPKGGAAFFDMGQWFSREEWAGWFEAQQHGVSWRLYLLRLQIERNAVAKVKSSSNMVSTSSAELWLEYDAEIQAAIERHASEQNSPSVWDGKRRV